MKKLFTLLLAFALFMGSTINLDAQSPRMAVVEEATQASCPPCASQNPPLQALLNQNTDKAIFIAYQVWWPGYDAMYLDNTTEVDWRIINNYYTSITGAPNVILQGNSGAQSVSYITQNRIDNIYAEMSEFDIDLSAEIVNGMINITGTVTATAAASGDLRLRLILTEDLITNDDLIQIGTNGETEFHHVFKKFIPGVDGIDLEDNWAPSDTYTIDETFDLSTLNIYHYDGLEVVAMIQNDDNKFIHQAEKISGIPITVQYDLNPVAVEVTDLPDEVCSGMQTITPSVKIQNGGNDELTTLDIMYDVNGGDMQTFEWTGSLSTLASETVMLDPITFEATSSNMVNVELGNPNGGVDEDDSNNIADGSFSQTDNSSGHILTITINTDCWPQETTWDIKDGSGAVIENGGPYDGQTETEIVEEVTLPEDLDCYKFTFYDAYGDGLNGSQWPSCATDGNVMVTDSAGAVIWEYDGTTELSEEITTFEAMAPLGVVENVLNAEFTVAPNPVRSNATINFTLVENQETMVRVLNITGQVVMVERFGLLGAGEYQEELDFSNLQPGVYFINLVSGDSTGLKKVTVVR